MTDKQKLEDIRSELEILKCDVELTPTENGIVITAGNEVDRLIAKNELVKAGIQIALSLVSHHRQNSVVCGSRAVVKAGYSRRR